MKWEDKIKPPWFLVIGLAALLLLCSFDWRVGIGWMLWSMAESSAKEWSEEVDRIRKETEEDQ